MRLAKEFGWVDYDEMMDHIGEEKFRMWWAFDRICPFGHRSENEQVGLMAAVLANLQIDKRCDKVSAEMFSPNTKAATERANTPKEFRKPIGERGEMQSPEEQIARIQMIAAAHNAGMQ
jgi:hypothetical protein